MTKKGNKQTKDVNQASQDPGSVNQASQDPGKVFDKNDGYNPGEEIKYLVLHCSASNLPKHDNIETIDRWHKERGFKMVGYHFFIQHDGTLEKGRPLDDDPVLESNEVGAHTLGINRKSIGVCLSGIDTSDFTQAQFKTLKHLVEDLQDKGMKFQIAGHNFFTDKKSCPCFDWRTWVKKEFPDCCPVKKCNADDLVKSKK